MIQSFEIAGLRRLSVMPEVRLLQLLGSGNSMPVDVERAAGTTTYASMMTEPGLPGFRFSLE